MQKLLLIACLLFSIHQINSMELMKKVIPSLATAAIGYQVGKQNNPVVSTMNALRKDTAIADKAFEDVLQMQKVQDRKFAEIKREYDAKLLDWPRLTGADSTTDEE